MARLNSVSRQIDFKGRNVFVRKLLSQRASSLENSETTNTDIKSTKYSSQESPDKIDDPSSFCVSFDMKEQKVFKKLPFIDPTEEMNKRWLKLMQKKIPTIDLIDLSTEVDPFN